MDKSDTDWSRAYNTEITRILRTVRGDKRITNNAIGESTGMHPVTVGRLLNDQRKMDLDQFFGLTKALGLDPATVAGDAKATVENKLRTSKL